MRSNPKFAGAFREVVAGAAKSTVRILCDGKETALGLIVGPDGWILTKAHNLQGDITCKLPDGREFEAQRMGSHAKHDLAILKIPARGLTAAVFHDSLGLPAGSWVACPGTDGRPVAFGIVSVASRDVPKNGGPILSPNVGHIGVSLGPGHGGVRIMKVMPKTGAEKAGLKVGDLILYLAGKKVDDPDDFKAGMQIFRPGDEITLKVKRAGRELEVKVSLGKAPPNRGEIQNNMGSKLSRRRSGYPTILQFDGLIKPADCGGPVVDLDGKVIGICICRAGRTENWAVPSEAIRPILLELLVANLSRPPQVLETKSESTKKN